MPKVDLRTKYSQETEELESRIYGAIGRSRIRQADLAKKLKVSQATMSRRLSDIDQMTLGDLRDLLRILKLRVVIRGENDDEG